MKKGMGILLCLVLLLALWGCAKEQEAEIPEEQALLAVNGQVIFTGKDLANYQIEQKVQQEVRGKTPLSQEEVFRKMAEKRLLAYFAGEVGVAGDPSALEDQYDMHLEEIQDTELYGDELKFTQKLQEALQMDDDTFRKWNIDENMIEHDVENLISDVAKSFQQVQVAEDIEEKILENLRVFIEMYDITCTYPGLEDWFPSFQYTVLS